MSAQIHDGKEVPDISGRKYHRVNGYPRKGGGRVRPHVPIAARAATPAEAAQAERPSYTQRLLADRNLRLKKLGEEMAELVTACADADAPRAAEEGADVLYHALVALRAIGVSLADVRAVLARRRG